jgi:hypothetical protein
MSEQQIFNFVISIAGAAVGWALKMLWDALKDLQATDRHLAEKVTSIEVLVAGKYATRDELQHGLSAIMDRLDRISDQLAHKADRERA